MRWTASRPTTYQLTGHDLALGDYVGQQVEVSGTVQARQNIAGTDAPAVDEPKGTSGTPTIETRAEIEVKQTTVASVTPSGERCAPELPAEDQPERRIR